MRRAETFTLSVFILASLWSGTSEALQCKSLFAQRRQITPLEQSNVIRVTQGAFDYVYKLFRPGEAHLANLEAESLRMFQDILQKSALNLRLKTVISARVTSRNEYGFMDFGPYGWLRSGLRRSALVTPFVQGQEVARFLEDPSFSIQDKKTVLDQILGDRNQLVEWLEDHPNYRFKGKPIIVHKLENGDVYEFPSKDGVLVYEYSSRMLQVETQGETIAVALDGISNMIYTADGDYILFDPH